MTKSDDRFAVMGIDPGGTTGVAACYFEKRETLKETLLNATNKKEAEVTGNYLEQGSKLAQMMMRFTYTANVEHGIPLPNVQIAIEDFVLRRLREGGATGNLTSCWVAAAATALYGGEVHWQTASQAKQKANNQRMKLWGLYVPGSEHKKDAWRHVAVRADALV